jgi:hypothetical protein
MIDIGSIASLLTSLKAASDITQALVGLRDEQKIQEKVIELTRQILSVQSSALAAQSAQADLLGRVRQLEADLARAKAWDTEKQNYELKKVSHGGVFAYVRKPNTGGVELPHWLCADCYSQGRKSILQMAGRDPSERNIELYKCHPCGSCIRVNYNIQPGKEPDATR